MQKQNIIYSWTVHLPCPNLLTMYCNVTVSLFKLKRWNISHIFILWISTASRTFYSELKGIYNYCSVSVITQLSLQFSFFPLASSQALDVVPLGWLKSIRSKSKISVFRYACVWIRNYNWWNITKYLRFWEKVKWIWISFNEFN